MKKESDEWNFFLESIWEFQYLKDVVPLSKEMKDVFYDECQGITAVAVNLFILAQERTLKQDKERLTVGTIRKTAKEDMHMVQPMIKALRNNNMAEIAQYDDISIEFTNTSNNCERDIKYSGIINDIYKERKKKIELTRKNTVENLILELVEMDIFDNLELNDIREICEKIVKESSIDEDYNKQKKDAVKECMKANEKVVVKNVENKKLKKPEGLISIYELAKKKKLHPYELLKKNGYIKDPVEEFIL